MAVRLDRAVVRVVSELWPLVDPWLLRATVVAVLAAVLETSASVAVFPTALSQPGGLALAWLGACWVFATWLAPLALLGAVLDRSGRLTRLLGLRDAPSVALATIALALVARWTGDSALLDRVQVDRERFHLLFLTCTLALAGVLLLGVRWWLGRHPPRALAWLGDNGLAATAATTALGSFACIHGLLAPANADDAIWPLGIAFLGGLLVSLRALAPSLPRLPAPAALALAIGWVAALPLSSSSEHALFALRGHFPLATSLYRPLDRLADADGDGARNRLLGGSDCDDLDATISPLSLETPGDGVDQDCRGGDAAPRSRQAAAPPWTDCRPSPDPPSVLLVTIDALRADGLDPELAPELHHFAERAASFTRAYAPASMTGGTTLSVFAARAMSDLNQKNVYTDRQIWVDATFTSAFRDAGYHVFALVPFDLHPALSAAFDRPRFARPRDRNLETHKRLLSADLSNQLMEEIAGTPRRYLAWVHYPDLHAPYVLAKAGDDGTAPAYLRALSYVDAHLGRVLAFLERSRRLESTVVIVTSDHGEQLGQRGRQGHGPFLFEEGIRVPLVLWIPGCGSRQVSHPVSLRHLAGTLQALTGIGEPQPTLFAPTELPVVSEEPSGPWNGVKRAVVLPRHKLVVDVRLGGKMLFDLEADPDELFNLYGQDEALTRSLEQAYQQWLDAPGVR